jgi:sugar-specific transcriptional regulator TrmB
LDLSIPEEAVSALRKAGLTKEQLKLYVLLVSEGPKSITEISGELRKDRAAVYKHLERLTKLGLVDRGLGSKNVYIARPAEKLKEIVVEYLEEEYIREKSSIESLVDDMKKLVHPHRPEYESRYKMIFGRKRLYVELKKLFSETHSEYRLITSANGLLRSVRHGLLDNYLDMLKRGVKVMVISEVSSSNKSEASLFYQYVPFRIQSGLQLRLNIFDQDRVLLGAIQHDEDFSIDRQDDSYMLITDRGLAKGFIRLFDTIYSNLEDAGVAIASGV